MYQAISISPSLQAHPFHSKSLHHKTCLLNSHKRHLTKVSMSIWDGYERDYDGNLIDENMVVLRKRIQEMKMEENRYDVPSEWMEWEKRYYQHGRYNSDICDAVGFLQSLLINARPSLAIGMVGLVLLSVPVAMVVLMSHSLMGAKWFVTSILHI